MCQTKVIQHDDFNAGFFKASLKAYDNTGNYVASPLSVLTLLATLLTARGPQGETAKQICEAVVGKRKMYTCTDDPTYTEVKNMLEKIESGVGSAVSPDGKRVLTLSNAAFIERSMNVNEQFIQDFTFFHGDKVMRTLFNTSEAFENINEWADKATNGMIQKYLNSPDELSPDTLMVLLNAITFSDKWEKSFEMEKTKDGNFRLSKTESIQVPMMNLEDYMIYFKDDDIKVVSKAFLNTRFRFVILLPKEDFDIEEIEDALKDGDFRWDKVTNEANRQYVRLQLPKFTIEHRIDLKPVLELLGIRALFTRGVADLSGISDGAPLYVSDAKQVAMMEVNEAGVKAAAVTGFNIMPMMLPPPPKPFVVDQPFYCAIYDSEMDMPLFIARVVDPTK